MLAASSSVNSEYISKSTDRNKKQIMWFVEPKDDKGIAFLKLEEFNKDIQMKMWLPAFKKVRRITAKKKGDSFMGSDLSFEDLSTRVLDDYFIIVKIFIVDIQKDHSTLVEFSNIKLDDILNDKLFHERNLQRLPKY